MRRAWYTGHSADNLGESAILVGDPDRVERIAAHLESPVFLPVSRGLKTVTGGYDGRRVSVVAFGMGAPIATIVLHEFAALGLRRFLRIGTAMYFAPAEAGEFLISDEALSHDGTAPAYGARQGEPVAAAPRLAAVAEAAARAAGESPRRGRYATFDAFYRDMFGIDPEGESRAAATRERLAEAGVMATDMETAALLAAGRELGVEVATLCLGTVDGLRQSKLDPARLAAGEAQLFRMALKAITTDDNERT